MPRPRKCRRVCVMPSVKGFAPETGSTAEIMRLTVDEFEMLRLLDLEGYTQEECADQMGVARTTVQAAAAEARRKLMAALVHGRRLEIEGGEYELCPAAKSGCARCCRCKKGERG